MCCARTVQERIGDIATQVAFPLCVGAAIAAPFLAGYSDVSTSVAIASGVLNTSNCLLSVLNTYASWHMEKLSGYGHGQSCGMIPLVSSLRNGLGFGLNVSSAAMGWLYLASGNDTHRVVNITLTTVSSVMTIGGTCLLYSCLYTPYMNDKSEREKLYSAY